MLYFAATQIYWPKVICLF